MFNLDSKIERLALKSSEVVTVISSGNRPNVAVAGPAQKADAYIISAKEGKKRSVYVCFHLIAENKRLFFTSDDCPTTGSKIVAVETDAISFVEDLGFVMVRKNILNGYSGDARGTFISTLVPFAEDLEKLRKLEEGEEVKKEAAVPSPEEEEDEYEEVVEEVYEEVPVEDEEDLDSEEAVEAGGGEGEVEYENLDDIVEDDDYEWEGKPPGKADTRGIDKKSKESKGVVGRAEKEVGEETEGEIGGRETLEDKAPEKSKAEPVKKSVPAPEASEAASGGEVKAAEKTDVKEKETKYFVDEEQRHIVRLLISL